MRAARCLWATVALGTLLAPAAKKIGRPTVKPLCPPSANSGSSTPLARSILTGNMIQGIHAAGSTDADKGRSIYGTLHSSGVIKALKQPEILIE